jgi:signal transduction histidine kinase
MPNNTDLNDDNMDERIRQYIEATERLKRGEYDVMLPSTSSDGLGRLGKSLLELAQTLEAKYQQLHKLVELTQDINAGLLLDNILEKVYENFFEFVPYNRIGFSLLEQTEKGPLVRAYWAKSDQPVMKIGKGYSAPLPGSSLEVIMDTGEPRILNDLVAYLENKPESDSTRLVVAEGMRSSLTCPLIANGIPVGFMFFSSIRPRMYADVHIDIFQSIAGQLAVIIEKGRLVTELATQKSEIEKQNVELRDLNQVKNRFLGMAAHDLRGPLGNIQLSATVLQEMADDLSPEEREDVLGDVIDQTGYMLNLLDELLDVTKIESGNLDLNREKISLADFLKQAGERFCQVAAAKDSRVILEDIPSIELYLDPVRLRQVIDNLLSNAIKYSPPGSTVWVGATEKAQGWRVYVTDQGPGISASDRQKLFIEFARLSARPTAGEKSIGLGLAITKRIVEAHGGEIGVDSEPGQGATFWFILPRRSAWE